MNNAEQIEQKIIELLQTLSVPVVLYPESITNYQPNANCEVLLRYSSSTYSKQDITLSCYSADIVIHISVVGQAVRGEGGIYETLGVIKSTLQGVNVPGVNGWLQITSEEFSNEYNGVWQYDQKWLLKQDITHLKIDKYEQPVTV